VTWFALVPFLVALRGVRPGAAFWWGLLWGHAAHWAIAWWVPPAIAHYYEQPWWFALGFSLVSSPVYWSGYYALFAAIGCSIKGLGGIGRLVLLAATWVTCEFARAHLLTGAPWLMFGYALSPVTTLAQMADVGGVYALSFLAVMVNAALAELWYLFAERPVHLFALARTTACAGSVLAASYAYGSWRLMQPLPQQPAVPMAIVQGNNEDSAHWRPGQYGKGIERYIQLSAQAAADTQPQVLIWPEAAITMFLAHEPRYQRLIQDLLASSGADLIVGAPHYASADPALPQFLNSAFYMTPAGISGRYDKVHLLPFVEYFPLRLDFVRRRFERVRAFVPGTDAAVLLDTRLGKAAVAICFEAIFPDLIRRRVRDGARVLIVLSNDVWLGRGAGPEQHLAMVGLRAIENRVWVLRATTTGISAVIDPFGRIVQRSDSFVPAVLAARVTPLQVPTIYKWFGDVFAWACVAITVVGCCATRFKRHIH
jgi:apolipoprotein N-acyltransferase